MYLKCLFCHSQVAATVPSYKARLRTVLLKAQLQERIAQIKPVISLSFVCFIWSITYLSFTLIRPWQKQWRISPAYERSQFVFCSKLFESTNIHDKNSHLICISASWNSHYRLPRAYGLWKTPKIHRGTSKMCISKQSLLLHKHLMSIYPHLSFILILPIVDGLDHGEHHEW